jgi:ribonuclease Z
MKLVFLGTAGMVPTKDRNVQSIYIDYNGEGILLDCGEGTQRQITLAKLNAQKIKKILISHWHGDHVSGLVGLIQTLGNFSAEGKSVKLFGPVGTKKYLANMMKGCIFETKLELDVVELNPKTLETFYENEEYKLKAVPLEHSVPCLGFRFEKKERRKILPAKLPSGLPGPLVGKLQSGESVDYEGKVIHSDTVSIMEPARAVSFIFDTKLTDACFDLADGSDVLISEAVYTTEHEHKAEEYKHLTARQVANIASRCGAKQLILTHFSQRYKDITVLEEDAKAVYENVICAYDFFKLELPF